MKTIINLTMALLTVTFAGIAENRDSGDKNITIIHGQSVADGRSDVSERILEECIVSLPKTGELNPILSSGSEYMKEINGDANKNEFAKTFSASLDINYILYQKVLVIVTTNSVQGQEPVMKVMEKRLNQSKHFESNSANGDSFAGRSHRKYYFSTSDAAKEDVVNQANAWIRQQSAVVCSNK
jgi:hypothetical protein